MYELNNEKFRVTIRIVQGNRCKLAGEITSQTCGALRNRYFGILQLEIKAKQVSLRYIFRKVSYTSMNRIRIWVCHAQDTSIYFILIL